MANSPERRNMSIGDTDYKLAYYSGVPKFTMTFKSTHEGYNFPERLPLAQVQYQGGKLSTICFTEYFYQGETGRVLIVPSISVAAPQGQYLWPHHRSTLSYPEGLEDTYQQREISASR